MDEPKEPEFVPLAYTVADPRAMVVVSGHAIPTGFAMLAAKWLLYMAYGAVLVLYVELDIVVYVIHFVVQSFYFNLDVL